MEPELFDKWVDALQSDKFEQTTAKLSDGHAFCCLGVLCEVAGLEKERSKIQPDHMVYVFEHTSNLYELPEGFRQKTKFGPGVQQSLIEMNDTENRTFHEIADYLEKNREKFVKN